TDGQGNPILLYELISSSDAICVLKAQYGEKDNVGRPKMFAHGFLFPAEGAYRHPEDFLAVADENFHFTDEETADIPSELIYDKKMDLKSALSICGLDASKWQTLMKCVYAMLASPTDYPVYVRCNGQLGTVKAAILCIFSALPYSLRYQLSFSNAGNLSYARFKRIMFVETVPKGAYYYDLESGETNLTTALAEVDQYAEKYAAYHAFAAMSTKEFGKYCDSIQETLDSLLLGSVTGMDEVNLAHLFVKGAASFESLNDSDLMKGLLELLAKAPLQNTFADDYIAEILERIEARELIPTETILKRIEIRRDKTTSANFVDVYKRIQMRALLSKGNAAVVPFLDEQYAKSGDAFEEWLQLIGNIPGGTEAIEEFFVKKIKECRTYEDVAEVNRSIQQHYKNTDATNKASNNQLFELAKRSILNTPMATGHYEVEFEKLRHVIDRLYGPDAERLFTRISSLIVLQFWKSFDYSQFEFNRTCIENGITMCPHDMNSSASPDRTVLAKYANVLLLSDIYEAVKAYKETPESADWRKVELSVSKLEEEAALNAVEAENLMPKLQEFLYDSLSRFEGKRHFCMWLRFARLDSKKSNPIPVLLQWDLPVINEPEFFDQALNASSRMREAADDIKQWIADAIADADHYRLSGEEIKILKRDLKILDEYIKEVLAEEKRKMKEQRKVERAAEADSRRSDGAPSEKGARPKPSLFGGLFGGRRRNRDDDDDGV
ncbi:MAG: hypothetical protein IJU16_04385, partial [Clostridia bacterium]|nr:hypothetical protein [Clostridia bacterium]